MRTSLLALLLLVPAASAADPNPFADVNPNVFTPDDPRAKDLPKMLAADARRRMREANLRESQAFAAVTTREQWEAHRDARIKALRESLGTFPEVPKDMRVVVTRKLDGDGYRIENLVYETRPGLWVTANLYLPAKPVEKMPGILISHSHHTPKTHGELQDMGMTWARSGCAVLVPDHLGHGERRQHDFRTEKDYPKPFRPSRQDYYFRYNSALQLSAVGESLMGWMVWDLMRGVDVLLRQPGIDRDRIILLGAVAGGGDPAGVTAALDPRIACVVPFNFSGWQPESNAPPDPDRDFAWFGEGYWETTRGLRGGAAGGFAHYVIVGSIAPRRLIYAHEFKWDPKIDPAWPRLQKIYGFYGAQDRLAFAHGAGSVRGAAGPENTHCTHIGAVHRKMIYPALKAWFDMPIPEEYSKRRPAEELLCWTEKATAELKPKKLHEVLSGIADQQKQVVLKKLLATGRDAHREWLRVEWAKRLGRIDPPANPKLVEGRVEDVPGGKLTRYAMEAEPGIVVPLLLIVPNDPKDKPPVVVMVAQGGKAAFLKDRGDVLTALLKAGVAVCLVDVRGTGETRAGNGSPDRSGARTSVSQTEAILGRTPLGSQVGDLRATIRYLQGLLYIDGDRIAVWGDSVAPPNPPDRNPAVPLDAPDVPTIAEPVGGLLAVLAALYEDKVKVVYARGGLASYRSLLDSPYPYVPHDAVVPGAVAAGDVAALASLAGRQEGAVDGSNRSVGDKPVPPAEAAAWVIKKLTEK
jgi:cephalosporin-C deacetylase-like acetyl esterase